MKKVYDYKIQKIEKPAILVNFEDDNGNNHLVLMEGKIRLQEENLIITDKNLLVNDKLTPLSFTSLFPAENYGLWK